MTAVPLTVGVVNALLLSPQLLRHRSRRWQNPTRSQAKTQNGLPTGKPRLVAGSRKPTQSKVIKVTLKRGRSVWIAWPPIVRPLTVNEIRYLRACPVIARLRAKISPRPAHAMPPTRAYPAAQSHGQTLPLQALGPSLTAFKLVPVKLKSNVLLSDEPPVRP